MRGLEEADGVEAVSRGFEPAERVLDDGKHGRLVARELGRTPERHLEPRRAPDLGDLRVFGREHDAREEARTQRRFRRVGEERPARQEPRVLARDPLRSSARRDETDDAHQYVSLFWIVSGREARSSAIRSRAWPSP